MEFYPPQPPLIYGPCRNPILAHRMVHHGDSWKNARKLEASSKTMKAAMHPVIEILKLRKILEALEGLEDMYFTTPKEVVLERARNILNLAHSTEISAFIQGLRECLGQDLIRKHFGFLCLRQPKILIRFFIESGIIDLQYKRTSDGSPLLHICIDNNDEGLLRELIRRGIEIDNRDAMENTALHHAAASGKEKYFRILLEAGADPRARNRENLTPLHFAAHLLGNKEVFMILVGAGADINARDNIGKTPLHYTAFWDRDVCTCLMELGADPNAKCMFGKTPLHEAASRGATIALKQLLEAEPNVNEQDLEGWTPLDYAVCMHADDTVELLLEHGAKTFRFNTVLALIREPLLLSQESLEHSSL